MRDANPAYFFPCTGSPKVLVILAQFQDVKFRDGNCWDVFNEYLNKTDAAITVEGDSTKTSVRMNSCSVRQFFKSCSLGAFEPQFDVYGPVTLSENMASYGANRHRRQGLLRKDEIRARGMLTCRRSRGGLHGVRLQQRRICGSGLYHLCRIRTEYRRQLIRLYLATRLSDKRGNIRREESLPLRTEQRAEPVATTYRQCYNYGCTRTNYINGIGLFCHEFSHAMGLPDIYPSINMTTAALTCNQNMDWYDLMDGGEYGDMGYTPVSYLAWERERCGWMQIEELTNPANITMETINKGGNAYKIVNDNNKNEYIVLENIQQIGSRFYWSAPLDTVCWYTESTKARDSI